MSGGAQPPAEERLSYATRLALRRAFVNTVALGVRIVARLYNAGARLIGLAETHGLDLRRAWDVRAGRRPADGLTPRPFGAHDFLLLADQLRAARDQGSSNDERTPSGERTSSDERIIASVIISAFTQVELTFQCLRSLLAEVDPGEAEVIVVDDGSTDETPRLLSHFANVARVVTNERGHGFVESCNRGASVARGRHLVFLDNDTEVQTGWLKSLIETAERDADVGAVGPLVLDSDGRVLEAGAIIWRDGEVSGYGRGRAHEDRRLSFAREVDCCSSASLLVRREVFQQLGGFDARFRSSGRAAFADLCLGLRSLGSKVVFQPLARVVRRDGATAERDAGVGAEQQAADGCEQLRAKWRDVLDRDHFARGEASEERAADRRRSRPEVLVVNDLYPTPERDAGSARVVFMLGILARRSRVVFVALNKGTSRERERERELWRLGVETLGQADFLREARRGRFRVAVLSRPVVTEALLPTRRRADAQLKIVFDMVDAHFIRAGREHALTGDARAAEEAARYRELEMRLARDCDLVWCASPDDARVITSGAAGAATEVIPTIHEPRPAVPSFDARAGLLFVGNFNHRPNVDAVHFLMREVMPRLRERLPDVALDIAGPHAPEEVRSYAAVGGVNVLGFVPDLEPLHERARVFVAPLRFGAGVKGKIGEALAHGLPVVTTSVGAEGMGLEHRRHAIIADDAREMADGIAELYSDPELWRRLSDGGREHVERVFSPRAVGRTIEGSITRLSSGVEKVSRDDERVSAAGS